MSTLFDALKRAEGDKAKTGQASPTSPADFAGKWSQEIRAPLPPFFARKYFIYAAIAVVAIVLPFMINTLLQNDKATNIQEQKNVSADEFQHAFAMAREQIGTLQQENKSLVQQLRDASGKQASLLSQFENNKNELSALQEEHEKVLSLNMPLLADAQQQIQMLSQQVTKNVGRNITLNNVLGENKLQLETLKSDLLKRETELKVLNEKILKEKDQQQESINALNTLKQEKQELIVQLASVKAQRDKLSSAYQSVLKQNQLAEKDLSGQQLTLFQTTQKLDKLKVELKRLKAASASDLQRMHNEYTDLLNEKADMLQATEQRLTMIENQNTKLHHEIKELNRGQNELKQKLAAKSEKNKKRPYLSFDSDDSLDLQLDFSLSK